MKKTAEEILEDNDAGYESLLLPNAINAMQEYANQETSGMYTEAEVQDFIKKAISDTMQGMLEYFESDNVKVIDKGTKAIINNTEISAIDAIQTPNEFIHPLLGAQGIIVIPDYLKS